MRFATLCIALLVAFHQSAVAVAAKSITCSYAQGQQLTFDVPKKLGGLPPIEFDYPSKVTLFSFRDNNLLLVAMDEDQPSRLRIVISAQLNKASGAYGGQIVVDMGGHELQVHAGPVACTVGR